MTLMSASVLKKATTFHMTSWLQGIAAKTAKTGQMNVIHCIWVQRNMQAWAYTYLTDPSFRSLLPIAPELTMKPSVSLSGKTVLSSLTIPVHSRQK